MPATHRLVLSLAATLALAAAAPAPAATLRIGLQDDPDALDPAQSTSSVGRVVFAALCDKLLDTDSTLQVRPQLATTWSWSPDNLALTLTLPEGPVDPAAPPTLDARAAFLWGSPGTGLALEGETRVAMARDLPGRQGFVFGLEDEPFTAGYAALAPATTDAAGAARVPLAIPASGPVSRPLTLTATLRVRDGRGRQADHPQRQAQRSEHSTPHEASLVQAGPKRPLSDRARAPPRRAGTTSRGAPIGR